MTAAQKTVKYFEKLRMDSGRLIAFANETRPRTMNKVYARPILFLKKVPEKFRPGFNLLENIRNKKLHRFRRDKVRNFGALESYVPNLGVITVIVAYASRIRRYEACNGVCNVLSTLALAVLPGFFFIFIKSR